MSLPEKTMQTETFKREWKARLDLRFEKRGTRTALVHREHYGPLVVQRPFYPEGETCHLYLIHPPGGLVGGDRLQLSLLLEDNTEVLLTTPSAGKFYRSSGIKCEQIQHLNIKSGGLLEWFPQENIFFNGSYSSVETRVNLAEGASFCGWEISCLGRPAAGEVFNQGRINQLFTIYRENRPVFNERNLLDGGDELLSAACSLNEHTVLGSMLATDMGAESVIALQEKFHQPESLLSVTLVNDLLIARYLGDSAEDAKKYFVEVWEEVRKVQSNKRICPPRIWYT